MAPAQLKPGPHPVWTLGEFHSHLNRKPNWRIAAVPAGEMGLLDGIPTTSRLSFGPFDEAKYGFNTIVTAVRKLPLPEAERLYPADGRTTLTVFFDVRGVAGSRSYSLSPAHLNGEQSAHSYEEVKILPATGEDGLPILAISVEIGPDEMFSVSERSVVFVDLRSGQAALFGGIYGDYGYGHGQGSAMSYPYIPF